MASLKKHAHEDANAIKNLLKELEEAERKLVLAEKVVEAVKDYINPFCGVTLNYASNKKLKPACEALSEYQNQEQENESIISFRMRF